MDIITLSADSIDKLAKAIVMAQIEVPDAHIEEQSAGWLEEHRGELFEKTRGKTQAERIEIFREIAPRAAKAVEEERLESEKTQALLAESRANAAARMESIIKTNRIKNEAIQAGYRVQCHKAEMNGRPKPPVPELHPTDPEEIRRNEYDSAAARSF